MSANDFSMKEVKSSNILRVGWKNNRLRVEFKDKAGNFKSAYEYPDVPEYEFLELMSAPSIGSYFSSRIRGVYSGVKVE